MTKRFIFGGTTEGRALAEHYLLIGDEVVVCVASHYGRELLPQGVICYSHPMELDEMIATVRAHAPAQIIDATHPFAQVVTRNIRACAEHLNIRCRRITREGDAASDWSDHVLWVKTAQEAAERLAREDGPVLLTTGSNTLSIYAQAIAAHRLYVRVLPTVKALEQCAAAGILPSQIIAMQGPFSEALNGAMYDHFGIRHVVSKDSGDAGGVREKVLPALARNLSVIMIRRPEEV